MTMQFAEPQEQSGALLIAIVDETYGVSDDDDWTQAREVFRLNLEKEFGLPFEEANIGPGADLPAFVTLLQTSQTSVLALLIALFFGGKPIKESLTAWRDMARKLLSFFPRRIFLNRQGAAVLAIDAVMEAMGGLPKSIRLLSYRNRHVHEDENLATIEASTEIAEPPATLYLGYVRHVFDIEADGVLFRVGVEGQSVAVSRLN
ncbi:MAG: hypothetical protein B7Z44_05275 [Caulobacter sp. 12-67-6]|nr:MAG: hypothetical protein B7Z44_05275 [Caulobacter sp. 12-67-6]OYX67793.1 MAG: hypothetical protein B7Y81_18415 [Caulobacter sp. 32-67-35]HQR90103.1 hypothetical protein [Caulobacter sp.]